MRLFNNFKKIDEFSVWIVLIISVLVSCVPFFALKHIKIANLPLHYIIIGGSISFLVILTCFRYYKKIGWFDKWLLILIIGFSLSLIGSVNRLYTLRSLVSFFLRGIGVSFVTSKIIDSKQKKDLSAVVLLTCACFVCLLGLIEFFSGRIPFLHHLYLKYHADYYPIANTPRGGMVSTIGHPLPLASYLVLLLPLSMWLLQFKKSFFSIFPFFLIFLTIIFSFSRSSWIAAFCAIVLYFFRKEGFKTVVRRLYFVILTFLIIILIFLFSPRVKNVFQDRIRNLKTEISFSHRFGSYFTVWNILKSNPIFGVGLGNYPMVHKIYVDKRASPWIETPDNMYLRIIAETGLVGITTFFIFILVLLKHFWKSKTVFSWAITCGLVGFLINLISADLFYWLTPQFLFWFLVGVNVNRDEN